MKYILALVLAFSALFAVSLPVGAHTGTITNTQACDIGTVVTTTLDDNVADTSQWVLTVRGVTRAHGTGPGPVTRTYRVGPAAGSATLTITYGSERHSYTTSWPRLTGCVVPRVYNPAASISPPCGDPMHRVTMDNHKSTGRVTFHVTYHKYHGPVVTFNRTLRPGQVKRTAYFHVQGNSRIFVSARGRLLDTAVSPKPGYYGKCPA